MTKKEYKQNCKKLQAEYDAILNLIMQYIDKESSGFEKEGTNDKDSTFSFFDKNANESDVLEAIKAIAPAKEADAEQHIREIRSEQKEQAKRMKAVEKQMEKCSAYIRDLDEAVYNQSIELDVLRAENKELKKKNKRMQSDLKVIHDLFKCAAIQNGYGGPGMSFKQLVKMLYKKMRWEYKNDCDIFDLPNNRS